MQELKIDQKHKDILNDFTKNLENIFQNNLVSVILYGSAVSGEFLEDYSNLNLLIVLKTTDPDILRLATGLIGKLKFKRINPLFLTEEYIKSSSDVFPIEFLDIKEHHSVLMGKDVVGDIQIDIRNLRFQCEQELKQKLLYLQQQYLRINRDKLAIKNLLFRSFTSILHIMRSALRLRGKTPPVSKIDILREMAIEFQVRIDVLKRILVAKEHPMELTNKEAEGLFINFLKELETLVRIIDQLKLNA